MAALRVALVGAGVMGGNHARVLSRLPGVILAGIVDADPAKAQTLAAAHGCPALNGIEDIPGRADAVVVASASTTHATIGAYLLRAGLPCLIEKPLAMTESESLALIAAAERAGVPLAVGHIERFNPAVVKAAEILADQRIHAFDVRRFNPGSARILDTDVVIDLMIHDLDSVLFLAGRAPDRIAAQGVALGKPGVADHATAVLGWGGQAPMVATVAASRITHQRVREAQILCDAGLVLVNYLTQEVFIARGAAASARPVGQWPLVAGTGLDLSMDKLFVRQGEALAAELTAFTQAVAAGRMEAGVSATEALTALQVVWAVQAGIAA